MRVSVQGIQNQEEALERLTRLAAKATVNPMVRRTAGIIVAECAARDDECELQAVFDAVKHGDPRIPGMGKGVRYVADPVWTDFFTAPNRLISECAHGACHGDCDDHTALIVALLGSLGWTVGLRAWGETPDEYVHVYAVAGFPKRNPQKVLGLDTTVESSYVGWEPPGGYPLTAWFGLEDD